MKTTAVVLLIALSTLFSGATHSFAAQPEWLMSVKSKEKRGGWLGVSIQDMTPRLARSMDLKATEGALVSDVVDDSPAEKAGIKDEDIIVEYNGKKIAGADDLYDAVRESKSGSSVPVVIIRKDERKVLTATVGELPKRELSIAAPRISRKVVVWNESAMPGLQLRELTEQLGSYFGAPDNRGVLVEEVEKDSKADKAGFKAGDVITRMGKRTIEDVDDVRRVLYAYDEGEKVDVEILRKGAKQTLSVEVEESGEPDGHGFRFEHRPHGFRFNDMDSDGLEELHIELPELDNMIHLEGTVPDLGRLKLDLNRMKREIQRNMRDTERDIRKEIKREINNSMRGSAT